MLKDPTKIYLETRATSSISVATPHQLIDILFEALLESLAKAKGAMQRGEVKEKAEAVKKSLDIIVRLQASLDFDKGGAIAVQLDELYTFCTNKLALANALNNTENIDDVYKAIAEIRRGWADIKGVT